MPQDFDPRDLISPEHYGRKGLPHDVWTRLRRESPVQWCESDEFENFWAITRHADIIDISGKPDVFLNAPGTLVQSRALIAFEAANPREFNMKTIIEMDPPQHRAIRKVASGFFTPRGIAHLDDIVERSARQLIDSLGDAGECDFIDVVAQRHPLRVLATILGIDERDEEDLLLWTQQIFAADDPDLQRVGADPLDAQRQVAADLYTLFDRIIQDRRANPSDDLASLIANAKLENGEALGPIETFGYYMIVFLAGHDTTRNALSAGLEAFARYPDQLELVRRDPSLVKSAVEEIIRWATPVNYMKRTAARDVQVRDKTIREGDSAVLFYASANRDEDVFDDPFRFDVTRKPNRHLGFGTGEHFCLGAHLARASMRALVHELATRLEEFELATEPTQIHSSFVVGRKTLPVRYKFRDVA